MAGKPVSIAIIDYPGALRSAVFGFEELFLFANGILEENAPAVVEFFPRVVGLDVLRLPKGRRRAGRGVETFEVVILPPSIGSAFCETPDGDLTAWLLAQHRSGAVLCSVCAGAFLLAATGLLRDRPATTHWALAGAFARRFPDSRLNIDQILIDDGDLVTAGGLMAWIDLGLELVARWAGSGTMRELARRLVVDSGRREQRFYRRFVPILDHHDQVILRIQHFLQTHFAEEVPVAELAARCCLSERMFLRRFVRATALKPTEYRQRLRMQKACELIEETDASFEQIASLVGYQDLSAFRKLFIRLYGLSPGEFKRRFVAVPEPRSGCPKAVD